LQQLAKAELAFMLPGFRFLFAAILLSMSILVFGLGAAALLRAAHEEFASIPARRGPPETMFAQQNESTRPMLALLRVDTPVEQTVAPTPAERETTAAAKPEDSALLEAAKPEIAVLETSPQVTAIPAQADVAAPASETRIAAVMPVANDAAPVAFEPTPVSAAPDTGMAATKIATLGGPAVAIEAPVASPKPDRSAIKKRQRAERAKERRRLLAQRARLAARQVPQRQQPADGFGQPAAATPIRNR
jgi:hypothetical protein